MARVAVPLFRVLFCGGPKNFPSAVTYTRESLTPYPHIVVETLPHEEVMAKLHEYDMCVLRGFRLNSEAISLAKKMKVIAQFGMGLEGVDIEAATKMGIKVGRIPSAVTGNALSCAEHAIYLMLGLLRDQKGIADAVLDRQLGCPTSQTLFKKTVLIIGYGNIGKELTPRLKPFGVRILAVRPSWSRKLPQGAGHSNGTSTSPGNLDSLVDERGGLEQLSEFSMQADIIVLCCPLTPQSRGMVNERFIANMKRGALLVNIARGGLIDYDAVVAGLKSRQVGGLGTDVTWEEPINPQDPILQLPNVLITPHVAGVTEMSYRNMGQIIAESAVEIYEGKPVTGLDIVN